MTEDKAITKITNYLEAETVKARFAQVVGDRNAGAYISSVLLEVANNENLQACTPTSIYTSALRAATLRLSVDRSLGQAYLVPFKDQATLIVGYKGLQDMAVRTNRYRYINVGPVYEGESVKEDRITGFHKFIGGKTGNNIIGWLGAFEMINGYGKTLYMTVDEIHQHAKKYSRGYTNPKGGWTTDTRKMERKTVIRLLLRQWGYLDPSDEAVLSEIEEEPVIIDGDTIEQEIIEREAQENASKPEQPHRTAEQIALELGYQEG